MPTAESFSDDTPDMEASTVKDALADAVVETIAYSDLFDYPLTASEIHRYLSGVPADRPTVEALLGNGQMVPERLERVGAYYTLPGRSPIVETRRRRAQVAADLWPKAVRYGEVIGRLPFVRMVAVTGALAVDNSDPGDDLDYLIVTEPGRLWLCRAIIIALVHLAQRRGDVICPNYFLSERALLLDTPSLYTAREVAQMIPLSGLAIYHRMRQVNPWVETYLPNAAGAPREITLQAPGRMILRTVAETLLRTPPGGWLEQWEMRRKIRKLSARDAANATPGEADFSPDRCKGHFDGSGGKILRALIDRLNSLEG